MCVTQNITFPSSVSTNWTHFLIDLSQWGRRLQQLDRTIYMYVSTYVNSSKCRHLSRLSVTKQCWIVWRMRPRISSLVHIITRRIRNLRLHWQRTTPFMLDSCSMSECSFVRNFGSGWVLLMDEFGYTAEKGDSFRTSVFLTMTAFKEGEK